ncbi:hypothetical protein Pint_01993 [Pistacia integerrima]|uniref:Uncharacterized protein n=1 Tax=Pistacia integerrima TaxID=434235 RepID=A0ACC0ZK59_9ROSI|nr:hypothetical protein Pint_01993 [Pistacia integerrima]
MSVEIPYDLIKQVQIAVLKEANLSSYDPDDASFPNLPSFKSSISELDPSPEYLRCKHCKGRLLRGVMSLICMFCGKQQAQQETAPEPIDFKSTFGCRWLLQSLALDGSDIAGVPVKAKELNRAQSTGQEEFLLSDFLDLEIKWQPELEKVESESDKSPLHLVGINLDNIFTEGKKDTVLEQQVVEDRNDDGGGDNDFQVRGHSSLENVKRFEPVVRSTEDESGGDSFDGWEASFQSADDGNAREESKLDDPVVGSSVDLSAHMDAVFGSEIIGSSAIKTNDGLQDDLWSSSNSEKLGKSNQVDVTATTEDVGTVDNVNNSSSMSIDFIQDAQWKSESNSAPDKTAIHDEDDSFDAWNDFTGSNTVENPTNISEAKQFEVAAIIKHGGEAEKANNSSSRSIDLVQGGQLQTDNIEIPDNKVINEGDDSFNAWNDFASSNSVQDTFNRQTDQAKQLEVNANIKDSEMENAKNSSSMNVDWFQDDQWQTTSKKAPENKTVDDLFDTWNDFTSSASAQDSSKNQSGQAVQFEVTTTIKDDKMVGNANNFTSIALIQDDHWPISSNKTPDSKTIDQGKDLFDTWNDFTGSTSVQDFPNEQTAPAKQSEITANVEEVNNSSFDWFQVDQGQTSSNKAPGDKTTEEDYDSFDAWNGFTSSTSAQDPSIKQSVNHVAPSVEQTSEIKFIGTNNNVQNDDFGSFSQAHFFSGEFSDQNGSKEVNIMQSEPSVSKRMFGASICEPLGFAKGHNSRIPDVNTTNGGNAREAAKSEDASNTTTKTTTNDVEMLMSQMHDLSFMLASNLSVPSKQDECGSFSKH